MAKFDPVSMVLSKVNGTLTVKDALVRWGSTETFHLNASDPQCGVTLPQPHRPFTLDESIAQTEPGHRLATLKFDPNAISNWHKKMFDGCQVLLQDMFVDDGVGIMPLTINLSCTEHPKQVMLARSLKKTVVAAGVAAVIVTALLICQKMFV